MALVHAKSKRFTVEEFTRLWELGAFAQERVELIEGEIVPMTPQGDDHVLAIVRGTRYLVLALQDTHFVAVQVPLRLSDYSAPEPDFFVIPMAEGNPSLITPELLRTADLIVELSVSSLAYDRDEKASLYAKYGVKDYWILNVNARQLEVYRDPEEMPERIFGHGYATVTVHTEAEKVAPLARPDVLIAAADLL